MRQRSRIYQNTINQYVRQAKHSSLGVFIRSLQHVGKIKKFIQYCHRHGYNSPISEPLPPFLYHGSLLPNKQLTPNRSVGGGDKKERKTLVYATSEINYAIFLAILRLKNASASASTRGKKLALGVDLSFVNGPSTLTPGYLHVIAKEKFWHVSGSEYATDVPVRVLLSIPVTPANLTLPIYSNTH